MELDTPQQFCELYASAVLPWHMQAMQYTWVEGWSEQYERPFFYNQETQESVWDRPPDLAWRRIQVQAPQGEL